MYKRQVLRLFRDHLSSIKNDPPGDKLDAATMNTIFAVCISEGHTCTDEIMDSQSTHDPCLSLRICMNEPATNHYALNIMSAGV